MTDAELAILSLLAEGPSYDHDLNEQIEARGLRKWTAIGNSSMYYVLEKLERQGLVDMLSEDHGHRRFQISAAGTGVLQTAVSDLLSTPHAHDKSFELGLANLHVLKANQVHLALQSRQQDIVSQIHRLRNERERANGNFQIESLFDHNISMMEAELSWLQSFLQQWESQTQAEEVTLIAPSIVPRIKQVILPQDADSVHKEVTKDALPSMRTTPPSSKTVLPNNRPLDETF
jgi:DNA-binding PadR family transcriptional regulator